jgi:hypothetical protein
MILQMILQMITCSGTIQNPVRQDLQGVVGTGGKVGVLGTVEGPKGIADAALMAAACAVASV